jgi:hypothetical protein
MESLGVGICTICGRPGYLLARIPAVLERHGIITVRQSEEISWCDVVTTTSTGEEVHEIWGHTD